MESLEWFIQAKAKKKKQSCTVESSVTEIMLRFFSSKSTKPAEFILHPQLDYDLSKL
jgi:hypothetical protein